MNRLGQRSRRPGRRLGTLWLVLLGLAWGILSWPAAAQDQEGLIVERTVQPDSGLLGDVEFEVNIALSGVPGVCPGVTLTRPVDVVLVLDRSGSMDEDSGAGGTKLELLKAATRSFIRQMDLSTDRVAVVQFDTASNVVQSLTNDVAALDAAIDSLDIGSGTAIDSGVLQAHRELQQNGDSAASPVLIVFTDGEQAGGFFGGGADAPIQRAREARNAGIRVIAIGLGEQGDVNPDTIRGMASSPDDAYIISSAADLNQVYQTIAQSVIQQPASATDVVVQHRFDATSFELVEGSVQPQTAVVSGNIISMPVAQVLEAPVSLSYRVRPRMGGSIQIALGDQIDYNFCGQTPRQMTLPAGLPVAVQEPTPTPTITPTPVPTASPTLPPTLTPAPTWTPTPQPEAGVVMRERVNDLMCDPTWLNWLFIILLLLFFAWLLWRIFQARQEEGEDADEESGCVCRLCRWIPWLAIPLTLLMLWYLLGALDLCPVRESLYYWRIEGGSRNGEIYITDPDGRRPAEEFAALGQSGDCVGCHAVASSSRRIAAISGSGVGPVLVYDLDGDAIEIPNISGSFVNWSPDGRLLAVADSNGDIQIVDVENGQISPLAGANDSAIFETMPAWSADGTTIAFVRGAERQNNFSITGGADIYVVPAAGGAASPLPGASTGGFNYYPAYSPDGRWLAFTRHTTGTTTYAAPEAEIYLVPAAGGDAIRLSANDGVNNTPLTEPSNSWPTWSLDGSKLAFNSKRTDPGYDLFMAEIDANGNSGAALPVAGASEGGIFEHLPFWGLRPDRDITDVLLGLWPFLLGYLLLALLYWLCKKLCPKGEPPPIPADRQVIPPDLLPPVQLDPLWQVAPTLVVGVGGTGRWVLTHLKKSLSDGGFGKLPDEVRFALIDTSERETTNIYHDGAGRQAGVRFAGTSLEKDEVLLLGPNLSSLIGQTTDAALAGWFAHDQYRGLPENEKDLGQGTRRRRQLARAGLIAKLREGAAATETPPDAARLWQYLVENSRAVRQDRDDTTNNDLVRVVLVGSMAGGMSGVLVDLAVLLRAAANEALPDGGTVNLEGYFTTEGAFRQYDGRSARQTNTAATAREFQRFQLMAGQPIVIDYTPTGTAEEGHPLRRTQAVKLFDEIVLFGGGGNYDSTPGKSLDPWATTLASMADVLALRLDRGTAAGTNMDHRTAVRGQAQTLQQQREQAVVTSAGSYTLRLPLVDMLQIVHTRWARKLYQVFLMGDQETGTISFDPAEAGLEQTPAAMAQEFIMGQRANAPGGMRAAGGLVYGSPSTPLAVRRLAEHTDNEAYRAYLGNALGVILNGSETTTQRLQRRAPQLGFATEFAGEVARLLAQASERAQSQAGTAPAGGSSGGLLDRLRDRLGGGTASAVDWAGAAERLAAWRELTERSYQSLRDVRALMSDDKKDSRGATVVPGLYAELNRRQADAEARRPQMDQVAARRYLWSRPINPDHDPADPANQQDLVEEWTRDAFGQLGKYLNRFHWQTQPDGSVRLSLVTYAGQRQIRLDDRDPETVRQLADELVSLAESVTRDVAGSVRLADVLPTQLSTRADDPEAALARAAWELAQPSITGGTTPGTGHDDFQRGGAVGIPSHVQRHPALSRLADTFGHLSRRISNNLNPVDAAVIGSTDSTALTVLRSYDLMPLFNLPEINEAWKNYVRNAGQQAARLADSSLLSAIFRADATALEYERRLEYPNLLNQDYRQLHPAVVHAMQRPEIVEAFGLALAAGWVTVRGEEVTLQPPGSGPAALTPAPGGHRPLLAALLQAVATWNDATPAWQQLRSALAAPPADTQQAWRAWIDAVRQVTPTPPPTERRCINDHPMGPNDRFCGECGGAVAPPPPPPTRPPLPFAGEPAPVQDLVAVATLAAARRLAGPEEWNRIVMPVSRIV